MKLQTWTAAEEKGEAQTFMLWVEPCYKAKWHVKTCLSIVPVHAVAFVSINGSSISSIIYTKILANNPPTQVIIMMHV